MKRLMLRLKYAIAMVDAYLAQCQGDTDWSAQCLRDARDCRCMLGWLE